LRMLQAALLTALVALIAAGCAHPRGILPWRPFGPGRAGPAPTASEPPRRPFGDASESRAPEREGTGVRKATAEEPATRPSGQPEAGRAGGVIYFDPVLPRGHVLR